MTVSTISQYMQISRDKQKWEKIVAAEPIIKAQTEYYQKNIVNVKTPADLTGNFRLFSYVMTAYGLGDKMYAKKLIQKVLEQGTYNQHNLAYTLNDTRIMSLAQTFDFKANGASATKSTAVKSGVVSQYIEQQLDSEQGQSNPGVQLALYFQQHAPSISSAYSILADKNLLTVVQTALGISPLTSGEDVDQQANLISKKLNVKDLQDPQKLQKFIEKFAVLYDIQSGNATQNVPNCMLATGSAASGVSAASGLPSSLLMSMQSITL